MQKFIASGNLGQDPEFKVNADDAKKSYVRFSVGVKDDRKNAAGEKETTWVNCVAFGATAKYVNDYLKKGSKVLIEGQVKVNVYQTKDGATKAGLDCTVSSVEGMDSRGSGAATATATDSANTSTIDDLDSIPF